MFMKKHQNNVEHQIVEVVLLTHYGFNIEVTFYSYKIPLEMFVC
jgi:hypothetical protein